MTLIIHSFLSVDLIRFTSPFSVASFRTRKTGSPICTPAGFNAPGQHNSGPTAAGHPTQCRTDRRAVVATKIGEYFFTLLFFSLDGRFSFVVNRSCGVILDTHSDKFEIDADTPSSLSLSFLSLFSSISTLVRIDLGQQTEQAQRLWTLEAHQALPHTQHAPAQSTTKTGSLLDKVTMRSRSNCDKSND